MLKRDPLDRWEPSIHVYHCGPIRKMWLTHVTVGPVGWVLEVHVYVLWGPACHGGGADNKASSCFNVRPKMKLMF